MCKSKLGVNEVVNTNASQDESDEFYIDSVTARDIHSVEAWYQWIDIEGIPVKLKLDTGADLNILSYNVFVKLKLPSNRQLEPTKMTLEAYNGTNIDIMGKILGVTGTG